MFFNKNVTLGSVAYVSQFGKRTGPIFLSYVACTGKERRLVDCNPNHFLGSTCSSATPLAGVKCEGISNSYLSYC